LALSTNCHHLVIMAREEIKRKDLWKGLNNVTQKDWIKVAEKLSLSIVKSNSGTSHYLNIRDPLNPDADDIRGLITTLTPNCFKQANMNIFLRILHFGLEKEVFTEDDVWRSLGKLK